MNYGKTKLAAALVAFAVSGTAFGETTVGGPVCFDPQTEGPAPGVQIVLESDDFFIALDDLCGRIGENGSTFSGVFSEVIADDEQEFATIFGEWGGSIDPVIAYSFGVTNSSTSVTTYTFTFLTPYIGGPYQIATTQHQSDLEDFNGNSSAAVTAPDGTIHNSILNGLDVGSPHALGDGCSAAGVCDALTTVTTGLVSPATGTLGLRLKFTLTPGDSYTTRGKFEITKASVPAPGILALLGLGLVGMGALRRRAA